jgi:hypothetical protein
MSDQHYRVSIGTYDHRLLEELHDPAGAAPISFVPVVAGAGATGADHCWPLRWLRHALLFAPGAALAPAAAVY